MLALKAGRLEFMPHLAKEAVQRRYDQEMDGFEREVIRELQSNRRVWLLACGCAGLLSGCDDAEQAYTLAWLSGTKT